MALSKDQEAWLNEHLSYEVGMLRHTFDKVQALPEGLDWNVHYESFVVHARNLYSFLCNKGESGNYEARHFVPGFKSRPDDGKLGRPFQDLNPQVLHMGVERPFEADGKFKSSDCVGVVRWLEAEMAKFVKRLQEQEKNVGAFENFVVAIPIVPDRLRVTDVSTPSTHVFGTLFGLYSK